MDNWKKQKVQLRRGTAAEWVARNTLLLPAEPGYETDTGRLKLGDGLTRWNSLAYWGAAEVTSGDYGQVIVNADGTWSVDITPADIGASAVGHTHTASEIVSGTLSDSRLSGNVVLTADARLSDAREWSAGTITQADAEAGVSTARQAFTALRVFQAIAAWWAGSAAKTKLDGIASGATANSTDAQLRDRSTHTGVQAISTVTGLQTALDGKQAAGTYATLVNGLIPSAQLPSYVDDVLEYADSAAFPATGESGKIYIAIGTNKTYRWGGTTYVEIASSPGSTDAVPEGAVNLYFTSVRASAAAPVQSVAGRTGAVTLAKADVGLGNVDNTSDANKPISTAAQAALDLKSPLASPSFTGQVAIPAGSAALPPLTFSGDPDTGIYRPDPNAFSIATGGAERMRVAGSYITAYSPAGVERWSFDINNGTQEIKGAIRGTLSLNSAYTTGSTDIGVVRFMNNAGVALGRMDVSGGPDTTSTGLFRFQVRNDTQVNTTAFTISHVAVTSTVPISCDPGTAEAPAITFTGDTDTGIWLPANNTVAVSTAGVERLRVEADGNVRIGVEATAASMLDVQASNAEVYPPVTGGLNGAARASVLTRNSSATTGSFASYGFLVTRGDGSQQIASIGAVSNEDTVYAPHLVFTVRSSSGNNTERLRITATGNMGIGTTAPSAMLDVNSSKVRVRSSHTPASASATGNAGDICWDSSYIYVCTATNTWRRIAHSTW